MENATKALLIAAAILIAILIISLSLVVYRMAAETLGNVNLSEAEMAQFNGKFENYVGTRVSGSQINALLATTLTHNQNETAAGGTNFVTITGTVAMTKSAVTYTKVPTSKYFKVEPTFTKGLITSIKISALQQ